MRAPHHEGLRPHPEAARGAVSKDTRPALSTSFRGKRHNNCHTREGGYPVRRGLSILSLTSLEYWVTRPSAQLRTRRVTTTECVSAFSRRTAPEVCMNLSLYEREQGMPGACCTRGLVCNDGVRCAHEHTGTAGALRHSLRNGLTAYAALSLETNSSCLHRCRLDGSTDPVGSNAPPEA